jgi:hypothetical protein
VRPSPGAIYLAAVTVLVAAGVLLGSRQAPAPVGTRVPEDCVALPDDAVAAVLGVAPTTAELVEPTAETPARFRRWRDDAGTVVAEVRCAPATATVVREQQAAIEAGELTVLDTTPPTTLGRLGTGTILRQVDADAGVARAWFVAAELDPTAAAALVEATPTVAGPTS